MFEMRTGTRQALSPALFEDNGPYFLAPDLNDAAGIKPREFGGSQYIVSSCLPYSRQSA